MSNLTEKLKYERMCLQDGHKLICGIDEVGRGPLAGPVVCAAVILPLKPELLIEGIDDSKKLSAKKRGSLCDLILKRAIDVKICAIEHDEIDQINILQAVKKCMKDCLLGLSVKPDIVLCDALETNADIKQISIIKGDAKSYLIGAASIVAKVYRDNLMELYDQKFPLYGFGAHKGYGTKKHIEMIKEIGPCEIHRKTFIKNFWAQAESEQPQNILNNRAAKY